MYRKNPDNTPIKKDNNLVGFLDNPVNQKRVYYRFYFNGWILPYQKLDNIEIRLNNEKYTNFLIRGIKRPDLNGAFPNVPNAENGGFEGIITIGDEERTYQFVINTYTDSNEKIEIGKKTIVNTREVIHDPPSFLSMGVISKCNLSCKMCPKHSFSSKIALKNGLMDKKLITKIISQLESFSPNLKMIGFQDYGEPFLYKDIFTLTDQVANILPKCDISLTTNGTLLNEELIDKIVKSRISSIVFSLDAGKESTYQHIRIGGNFIQVINYIRVLISKRNSLKMNRPYIGTNFLIMRSNLDEIFDYVQLGESLQVDGIGFVFPFGLFESDKNEILRALHEEDNEFSKKYEMIKNQLENSSISKKRRYFLPNIQPHPLMLDCSFNGKCSFYIDTVGDVYPCCVIAAKGQEEIINSLSMGNIKDHSLKEIWEGIKFVNFREKFYKGEYPHEICKNCPKYYGI